MKKLMFLMLLTNLGLCQTNEIKKFKNRSSQITKYPEWDDRVTPLNKKDTLFIADVIDTISGDSRNCTLRYKEPIIYYYNENQDSIQVSPILYYTGTGIADRNKYYMRLTESGIHTYSTGTIDNKEDYFNQAKQLGIIIGFEILLPKTDSVYQATFKIWSYFNTSNDREAKIKEKYLKEISDPLIQSGDCKYRQCARVPFYSHFIKGNAIQKRIESQKGTSIFVLLDRPELFSSLAFIDAQNIELVLNGKTFVPLEKRSHVFYFHDVMTSPWTKHEKIESQHSRGLPVLYKKTKSMPAFKVKIND